MYCGKVKRDECYHVHQTMQALRLWAQALKALRYWILVHKYIRYRVAGAECKLWEAITKQAKVASELRHSVERSLYIFVSRDVQKLEIEVAKNEKNPPHFKVRLDCRKKKSIDCRKRDRSTAKNQTNCKNNKTSCSETYSLIVFLTSWRKAWNASNLTLKLSSLLYAHIMIREQKKGRGKSLPEKRSRQLWPKEQSCQYVQVRIILPNEVMVGWSLTPINYVKREPCTCVLFTIFVPTTELLRIMKM